MRTTLTNSTSPPKKKGPSTALIAVATIFLALLVTVSALYFDPDRKEPMAHLLSPFWWFRHAHGTDLYDKDTGVLYEGTPKPKEIALTIDDGPNPIYGPGIIETLHSNNCPATFFVVGVMARKYPNLLREMVKDGDEIGNHTYNHMRLPALKPHEIADELRDDDHDIFIATGIHTRIMRPPGMEYDHKVLTVNKALGYRTISWTVAAKDYLKQDPKWIASHVVDATENGSIILLHQDTPYTVQALPTIIAGLRAKGYTFVTISTMLKHMNVPPLDKLPPKSHMIDIMPGAE